MVPRDLTLVGAVTALAEEALPPALLARMDPSPDRLFYATPRLVTHIDAATIAALTSRSTSTSFPRG